MVQLGSPGHHLPRLTVLRCGDPDTADRVMAVLKRHAERISDTIVAIDHQKLTATNATSCGARGFSFRQIPPLPRASGWSIMIIRRMAIGGILRWS